MENLTFNPPEGLTRDQVGEILQRIATKVVRKNKSYIFGYNSEEDIIQQGVIFGIICMARGKYRPELFLREDRDNSPQSCLERFMSVHINHRLFNYRRDNSRRNVETSYPANDMKYNLMHPLPLDEAFIANSDSHSIDIIHYHDTLMRIKKDLSKTPDLLNDFYRVVDGVNIPQQRKLRLKDRIKEILDGQEKESQ
jgi:hypothetical protein